MKCRHLKANAACEPATRFFTSRWLKVPALCGKHASEMIEVWSEGTDGLREISEKEFEDLMVVEGVHQE